MFDIAIIGLGPAGATLARLLSKELTVIAIDQKDPASPDGFQKPCGGLLATDAQKALSRFNLTLPVNLLVDPQIFSVRTIDLQTSITRHYQRFYINLDRHKFDLWLCSLIAPHVQVETGAACKTIERINGGYRVSYLHNGVTKTVEAKMIVGADGAHSMIRNTFFKKRRIRQYTAIQQWFAEEHATPFYSSIFDATLTNCYAWSVSKNGYFIFGAALPKQNSRVAFEKLKEKLAKQGFLFGEPLKTEACLVSRPSSMHDFCLGGDGAFLIGEAAGFISPTSLEGISFAFESGRILAEILNGKVKDPHEAYRRSTFKIRSRLIAKHFKAPFMYFPPLRRLIMKSGIHSVKVMGESILK